VLLDLDVIFHPERDAQPDRPDINPDDLPPDWREWYEERLSIMGEGGGPLPRHLKIMAMADTLEAMRRAGEWPIRHRRFSRPQRYPTA
jgi:hypothetical protein